MKAIYELSWLLSLQMQNLVTTRPEEILLVRKWYLESAHVVWTAVWSRCFAEGTIAGDVYLDFLEQSVSPLKEEIVVF
jgi:hypothetical protein